MIPPGPLFHKPSSVIAARNILFATLAIYVVFYILAQWVFEPSGQLNIRTATSNAVLLILLYVAVHFIGFGKNWARILFTVLFGLQVVTAPFYVRLLINANWFLGFLYLLVLLLQVVALIYLFSKPSNEWFNRFKYSPPHAP